MEKTTLQQGLNEVARKRVHRMIDNNQPLFRQTMQRLMQEAGTANDYLASIGAANRTQAAPDVIFLEDGNKLIMNMAGRKYGLHRNAVGQLAEKVAVPAKYLRELSEGAAWQRRLAAEILNQHSSWTERSRLLVRTVDDQVRGVLSDSYRRLNSVELVTAFLSAATAQGGVRRTDDRHQDIRGNHHAGTDLYPYAAERNSSHIHGRTLLDVRLRGRCRGDANVPPERRVSERYGARERDETDSSGSTPLGESDAFR